MRTSQNHVTPVQAKPQRGVVLFFALIALVVMSLAAVALIRSVDTSTLIAGNLAFKQSATSTGDTGAEAAITWLAATELANAGKNIYTDATHTLNITNAAVGYYSNLDPAVSLTDGTGILWTSADSASAGTDISGNTIRYVIQRMCRPPPASQLLSTVNCLFSEPVLNKDNQTIPLYTGICTPPPPPDPNGCPVSGQAPQYRITARIMGQKNTASYIQAFVY